MTNRIQRLKDALFANPREISLERAVLYTESHRQTEGEPVIIRRAKATAHILDNVAISLRDDELIAGNRTIKPRAGIMSPEMDPYWLLKELEQLERKLAGWQGEKKLLDERVADPALYSSGDSALVQSLLKRQGELAASIDSGEERWLEIQTELEDIGEV